MEIQNTVTDWKNIPEKFVSLDDCENIMIKSCDFTNDISRLESPTTSRGKALYTSNSSLAVEPRCLEYDPSGGCNEWDPSYITGFTYGIYAMSLPMIPLTVNRTIFEDNARGLYMSGCQPAEVVLNQFLMDDGLAPTVDTIYGMYMDHCEGYHVEGNLFEGNLALDEIVAGAVIVDSDEGDNEIYNNVFRHLDVAIEPQGTNRTPDGGLCLKCNDFTDNYSDLYIYAEEEGDGIAEEQGVPSASSDPTLPAGNTFSSLTSHQYDIFNEGEGIMYVYHGINNTQEKIIPDEDYHEGDIELHRNQNARYTKEGACPSKLGGGGSPETLKSEMALNEQKADSTQTELIALVDGGDTEDLTLDVVMSLPDEALEIHQQLLDDSPYLSDTIMKSAIYKEDVLPNAMIRDVLVANPQSAKSDEVLTALDDRWDPMPDYMMDEIMAGADSLGSKELLESRVRSYRHLRNLAYNELVGIYLQDTVNEWAPDSLVALLQNENRLNAKYSFAFYYLGNGDTALMNSELNTIPASFTLAAKEQLTHQDYYAYIDILKKFQFDTISDHYPDSSQIATLFALADSCDNLPSLYARNMLIHYGLLSYDELVYFPVALYSSIAAKWPFMDLDFPRTSSLTLFPNPAGDYFIVEYTINTTSDKAVILIHEIEGKHIQSIWLQDNQNQIIVPTGNLPNGVYLVSMFIDNTLIGSKKITILK
jgi:hypothetical protein